MLFVFFKFWQINLLVIVFFFKIEEFGIIKEEDEKGEEEE